MKKYIVNNSMSALIHNNDDSLGYYSFMVDAADRDKIEPARNEIHSLLDKPQLAGIPVLVLGNKRDLPNALDEKEIIDQM